MDVRLPGPVILVLTGLAASSLAGGCRGDGAEAGFDAGADTDADADADADTDTDGDTDSDSDSGSATGSDGGCDLGAYDGVASIETTSQLEDYRGYTSIGGDLQIGCQFCNSLEALHCLEEVGGNVEVCHTESLADLDGLDALTAIGGALLLGTMAGMFGNDALADLGALANLQEVGSLTVYLNPALTSLAGLEQVESLGSLHVEGNAVLADLDGLAGVAEIDHTVIAFNESLSDCEICELWDQLASAPEDFYAMANLADGCTPIPDSCP